MWISALWLPRLFKVFSSSALSIFKNSLCKVRYIICYKSFTDAGYFVFFRVFDILQFDY